MAIKRDDLPRLAYVDIVESKLGGQVAKDFGVVLDLADKLETAWDKFRNSFEAAYNKGNKVPVGLNFSDRYGRRAYAECDLNDPRAYKPGKGRSTAREMTKKIG